MSPELDRLLGELEPATAGNLAVRLRFGLDCALRVKHLLEDTAVLECLAASESALHAGPHEAELAALAARSDRLANGHAGSRSLDGVGHAAVSATYACAKAIAGKARQAAEYAAYAAVYGQGGYGATSDASAYEPAYAWQAERLAALLGHPTLATNQQPGGGSP